MKNHLFHIDTIILTGRTIVRRFREGDGDAFHELIQTNTSYLEDHFPKLVDAVRSPEEGEVFVRQKLATWLLQEEFSFGIWTDSDARLIGFIRLHELDWNIPKARISFFIDQNATGKGLMTEILAKIIGFGFQQLQLNKLIMRTMVDNYATQRVARKVGFRREGDLRGEFKKISGALVDLMVLGLTREEYGE